LILGSGTVALDTVETPFGSVRDAPGGSALYFAAAAARLLPVAVVGVTGEDFPGAPLAELAARGVDVSGIERRPHPTFRWHARYDAAGLREILSVHRGGIVREVPVVPPALRDPEVLFLGSTDPSVQGHILSGSGAPGRVVLDSMGHWIRDRRRDLASLLARVDVFLADEEELRLLGAHADEGAAAAAVRALGPSWVVVKRGARGACAWGAEGGVEVAGVPVAHVVDPTGAGDAFAGGLVAKLAGGRGLSPGAMREALRVGARMGALAVEAFSFEALLGER